MYLFQRVEELTLQYQDSRREVAAFVLRERDHLDRYTMQEIADQTFTSKATLVRFAKAMGFQGWREFMKAYAKEARYQVSHYADIDPNIPFTAEDRTVDIIRKIGDLQVESILDTADLLDAGPVDFAVDRLMAANRVVIFGMSPNSFVAQLFRRKMQSIGKFVLVPVIDECGMIARSMTERDCGIIISYSGNNDQREPMRYIKALKENRVPLIGITSGGENYIRSQIACVLTVSSRERLYSKIAGFSTEISLQYIMDTLYACCFARDYQRNLDFKVTNSIELENRRSASLLEMREK